MHFTLSHRVGSFVLLCICCILCQCSSVARAADPTSSLDTCDFKTQRVQCGDYACDATSHVCVRCKKDSQCYPAAMACDVSTGKCKVKPFIQILNISAVFALIGAFAVCAIGVIAGVGGGGILVPMFAPMMKLPMMTAVALSQSTICGQTTLNVYLSLSLKHPDSSWDRPLINYQYLGLLLPLGLIGTLIGSLLNNICSDFLRLLLLFVLLTAVLIRTIMRTRKQFAADRAAARATLPTIVTDSDVRKTREVQPKRADYKATTQSSADNPASAQVDEPTPSPSSVHPPMPQYPILEITMFLCCFFLLLVFNVLRAHTTCGNVLYWIYVLVPVVFLFSMFYYHRSRLVRLAAEKPEMLTFKWTRNSSTVFPFVAVVAGAAASMLGIGGGLVLGFVMYEVELVPEETSITGGTATFLIATSSGLQLLFAGKLQIDSGVIGFFIGMASTALGQLVLMKYIREHGLRFLIVASLALIVGGSLLILGGVGIHEAIDTIRDAFALLNGAVFRGGTYNTTKYIVPLAQMIPSDDEVCDDEANSWRVCVEKHLGNKSARKMCFPYEEAFDSCMRSWRTKVGPDVRIKGLNEGDPPPQCAAMSCLVGSCLRTFNYDFDRCKVPMDCFKKCVKGYFGDEYIR